MYNDQIKKSAVILCARGSGVVIVSKFIFAKNHRNKQ